MSVASIFPLCDQIERANALITPLNAKHRANIPIDDIAYHRKDAFLSKRVALGELAR